MSHHLKGNRHIAGLIYVNNGLVLNHVLFARCSGDDGSPQSCTKEQKHSL